MKNLDRAGLLMAAAGAAGILFTVIAPGEQLLLSFISGLAFGCGASNAWLWRRR